MTVLTINYCLSWSSSSTPSSVDAIFLLLVTLYIFFWQGGSGRFDLTVGPKQTMGKLVSGI